ncbi:cell division protein FtsQ/DivIB [Desulfonatronum thioautotrophicum]|uniref:cell division protein FtsQ/DivIB n=1 Tax=Desulfonatronum thioautotrophicum TaxID=617001 RepID=UPI00069C99E2|nr:FtsQ-type POTRA domain-containing protein [Desulfonatronum thioautotrophicum]
MSVAAIRIRSGGWFSPGTRKSNTWSRQKHGTASLPKRAVKPARNKAATRRQVRIGGLLVTLALLTLRVLGWALGVLSVVGLLGVISLGLVYGYRGLTSSAHFAVSHVEIAGNKQLSVPEILNLSGVAVGVNTLEVSLGDVSRRLQGNPWIESATVRRVLPDGVAIEIVEREPFFWIQHGEALYYADRSGAPIAALELGRFVSLPLLLLESELDPNWRLLEEWMRAVERLEFPFGFSDVAWIRVEDANMLRIHLEDRGMMVDFDLSDWRVHRGILGQVWEDLRSRGELDSIERLTVMSGKAWVLAQES